MSLSLSLVGDVQPVTVSVSAPHTGLSAADLAQLCTDKIVYVGPEVPPVIRAQAHAFKDRVLNVTCYYLTQAQRSERTTVIGILEQAGHHAAAELLRKS